MGNFLTVNDTKKLISFAIKNIEINQEYINSLNVFPVPDGDTGTNVYATMNEAFKNIKDNDFEYAYEVFNEFAKQMLYSARGNSGVIHSQVFAGLAKGLDKIKNIGPVELCGALLTSKEATYNSVLQPQEGTILTVIRIVCENSGEYDRNSLESVFKDILKSAIQAVELTPSLLPVLQEVGVVDSGATALKMIFEGMSSYFSGEKLVVNQAVDNITNMSNNGGFTTEEMKYIYCTEFLIILEKEFDKKAYVNALSKIGDSIVAIELDGIVKSHVHTNEPNKVIEWGLKFGMLNKMKIDNMHFEHNEALEGMDVVENEVIEPMERAIIAVANSSETATLFKKIGVNYVIDGGQSKNPSTKDFVDAINKLQAKEVIIFPNNSNIFMSAEQTKDLVTANVEVIKSRSVVQTYSTMIVADKEADFESLVDELNELLEQSSYGEITKSVRDTRLNDIDIKKNDYLGIYNKDICVSTTSFKDAVSRLLEKAVAEDKEVITLIKGKEITKKLNDELDKLIETYEGDFDLEFDVIEGNQELYHLILGAD